MKKISLFALLLSISYVSTAPAQVKTDGEQYAPQWDVVSQDTCKGTGEEAGWSDFADYNASKFARNMMQNRADNTDLGYGAVYYVAREMNDYGYKFCKTVIAADRDGGCTKKPYTTYYDVAGNTGCFWLCANGHWGDGCSQSSFVTGDTGTKVHNERKGIADGKIKQLASIKNIRLSATNIEDEIPMLKSNVSGDCSKLDRVNLNSNKSQEHDTVLVIKSVVVDGSNVTYTIQPLAVRAGGYTGCLWGGDDAAWPMVAWTGKEKNTYCPTGGYIHRDGGGCSAPVESEESAVAATEKAALDAAVAQAKSLEEQGLAILCQGFDRAKYDNKVHVLNSDQFLYQNWRTVGNTSNNLTKEEYIKSKCPGMDSTCVSNVGNSYDSIYGDASATCTVFSCKNGMGYISDPVTSGDFSCHDCKVSKDTTIHPSRLGLGADGICKVCEVGKVYNADTKDCANAKGIHKFKMAGISNPDQDIKNQCWTMSGPDEYKQCMKGYINSTTEMNDNFQAVKKPSM